MVSDFLKKMNDVYEKDLISSKEKLEKMNNTILENDKFIELLKSESQNVFRDFSPREPDNKNNKRILEIQTSQDTLRESKKSLEDHISSVEKLQAEIHDAMDEVKELEMAARDSQWFETNVYNAGDEIEEPIVGTSKHMDQETASKLENILTYLLSDPMRAKMELQKLI